MGAGYPGERTGKGVNDDDSCALQFDRFPHFVGQEMIVDQEIGARDDDCFTGEKTVVTVCGTYSHFPESGGHLSRMVEGGGGNAGFFEDCRDPGNQK